MDKVKKGLDVSGTKPERTATASAEAKTHEASKRPLWSRKINRVECSVWKHDQDGEWRYTVALSRSYFDKKSNEWKRNYYFDRQDLRDIHAVCEEAEEQIRGFEGMKEVAGED